MRFTELNLLGVYVAPISVLLVAAWLVMVLFRRAAVYFGVMRRVWHPALFNASVYVIILSGMVFAVARWGTHG